MRLPPLRDWMPLGRPLGEWAFCALLLLDAANELSGVATADPISLAQSSVVAMKLVLALCSIGIVASIVIGLRIGIVLVWSYAVFAIYTAAMATWAFGGAPRSDVFLAGAGAAMLGAFVIWYGRRRLYGSITRRRWPALVAEHSEAVEAYVAALEKVPPSLWTARATEDGWSPA